MVSKQMKQYTESAQPRQGNHVMYKAIIFIYYFRMYGGIDSQRWWSGGRGLRAQFPGAKSFGCAPS